MNGKGDTRRPSLVSRAEYEANWNRVFGKEPSCSPTMTGPTTPPSTTSTGSPEPSAAPAGYRLDHPAFYPLVECKE